MWDAGTSQPLWEPIQRQPPAILDARFLDNGNSFITGGGGDTATIRDTAFLVHDFPEGLPEGRYDLWVTWEAPCRYWQDIAFTEGCEDPDEVLSLFSAGVNSPFDAGYQPEFEEPNQAP